MALFLDIQPLTERGTNAALELIYKSIHDHGDGDIWDPHDSPLIRRLIELFTRRGLDRLEAVKAQLLKWQAGDYHKPSEMPVAKPDAMERWSASELDLVRLYLESLPPDQWTLDDHMMAVDFLVQRYLPANDLRTEAEWLATRASLMGKVQANLEAAAVAAMTGAVADKILAALPTTASAATSAFNLPAQEKAALEFATARAAENVRALAESARHRMRSLIVTHLEEQQAATPGQPGSSLQTKLFDEFATLNRDWRRIAITEAGEAQNQGFIAALKPGTQVRRLEQYRGACGFCRKIDGVTVTVVAPDHPNKDPDTMIWPGKNNIGRSASPRKRIGNVLVKREASELWTIPAGLAHPHCRGRWLPTIETPPGGDPEFAAILRGILS